MKHTQSQAGRVRARLTTLIASGVFALALAGCGAAGEAGEAGEAGQDAVASFDLSGASTAEQSTSVESSSAALSVKSEECNSYEADESFDGNISPKHKSVQTYSNPGCGKAYIVELLDIDEDYTVEGHGVASADINVWYDGAKPTTQSACENTMVRAIVYTRKKSNGDWDNSKGVVDSRDIPGRWEYVHLGFGVYQWECVRPYVRFYGMKAGDSYRFAMTARSGDSTRPVSIETDVEPVIR